MSNLFLILHRVRGQPAFDVALHFSSPPERYDEGGRVKPYMDIFDDEEPGPWWVIPTSNRRAFPYWSEKLHAADTITVAMPENWPDHYPTTPTRSPASLGSDFLSRLGFSSTPVKRRRV